MFADSPVKPTSTDTVSTLLRMLTFGLLERHDGTEEDVPNALRGELSPYRSLTVGELESLYYEKLQRRSPSRFKKNDFLTALVKHDQGNAQQQLSNHKEAEELRQKLTKDCFDVIVDPSLGLLRSAPTIAKTLFAWCADDIHHVPPQMLQQRADFLQQFKPSHYE